MAELKSKRDDFTKTLTLLRKEVKVATNILDDNYEIKRNMKAEKAIQQKRFIDFWNVLNSGAVFQKSFSLSV